MPVTSVSENEESSQVGDIDHVNVPQQTHKEESEETSFKLEDPIAQPKEKDESVFENLQEHSLEDHLTELNEVTENQIQLQELPEKMFEGDIQSKNIEVFPLEKDEHEKLPEEFHAG